MHRSHFGAGYAGVPEQAWRMLFQPWVTFRDFPDGRLDLPLHLAQGLWWGGIDECTAEDTGSAAAGELSGIAGGDMLDHQVR